MNRRILCFSRRIRRIRLKGSFTIEAAYIFPIVFFCISVMLRFAWSERNACLADFVLQEHTERAARIESVYDPNGPDTAQLKEDLTERFSSIGALAGGETDVERRLLKASSSLESGTLNRSAEQRIFSPENTMRAATAVSEFASKIKTYKGGNKIAADTE